MDGGSNLDVLSVLRLIRLTRITRIFKMSKNFQGAPPRHTPLRTVTHRYALQTGGDAPPPVCVPSVHPTLHSQLLQPLLSTLAPVALSPDSRLRRNHLS